MKKYNLPEYLIGFIKEEVDDENGVADYKIIGALNEFYLRDKILSIMKQGNYISFFFAKRCNIGDIDSLNYATHGCEEQEMFLCQKEAHDKLFY